MFWVGASVDRLIGPSIFLSLSISRDGLIYAEESVSCGVSLKLWRTFNGERSE